MEELEGPGPSAGVSAPTNQARQPLSCPKLLLNPSSVSRPLQGGARGPRGPVGGPPAGEPEGCGASGRGSWPPGIPGLGWALLGGHLPSPAQETARTHRRAPGWGLVGWIQAPRATPAPSQPHSEHTLACSTPQPRRALPIEWGSLPGLTGGSAHPSPRPVTKAEPQAQGPQSPGPARPTLCRPSP